MGATGLATPSLWTKTKALLPQGLSLQPDIWKRRHRTVLAVVFAHAPLLAAFGLYRGWSPALALGEAAIIAGLGALAAWSTPSHRFRASVAAFAAVSCSAVLVQFSGGYIEAHFHFFIMVALIALYQDWLAFLIAVAYVALDHGILGQVAPGWVYNHPAALANPWGWAAVHAAMVLGQCAALLVFWRGAERERARSEVILASAGEGLLGLNEGGTVQFANPAAAQILGQRGQDLVGSNVLGHLRGPAAAGAALSPGTQEYVGVRADGVEVPVLWAARRAEETDAGVHWVVALHDLSDRKRQERERLAQLLEQDRFKTQLLQTASHELNTPISVVRLQLELLKRELPEAPPRVMESLALLERNVARLGTLVQQTLDVARIQGGRFPIARDRVDLGRLVQETCRSFAPAAQAKDVALAWEVAGEACVAGDADRLSQVLYNLIANAIRFTPAGGAVGVRCVADARQVQLVVADDGAGLAPEDIPRLFQPFSQVGHAVPGGAGLGLYISKSIVDGHGGTLTVSSAGRGRGATFTCTLPLWAGPAQRRATGGEAAIAATS